MIRAFVVALFLSAAHAQYTDECPPENVDVATFRYTTRDLPPIAVPSELRMEKDRTYAVSEIQIALEDVPSFGEKLRIPPDYITDPFVERCCPKVEYNCTSLRIELRYVRYQDGTCWIVWPFTFFTYVRCTCCTCMLDDKCPVVGKCVETDYVTVKLIAYCPHVMYSDRFQKLALRIPQSCQCTASCPLPQNYFYKKAKFFW